METNTRLLTGDAVSLHYATLIAYAPTRDVAIERLVRSLNAARVKGGATTDRYGTLSILGRTHRESTAREPRTAPVRGSASK